MPLGELSPNINTREFEKFGLTGDGYTAVRILGELAAASSTFAKLVPPNDFKITTMTVGDTATKLPATPSANRVGIEIQNYDATNTLYWGPTVGVTADLVNGTTSGKQLRVNESTNFQMSDGKDVYGIAETGKTVLIQVTEWIRNP